MKLRALFFFLGIVFISPNYLQAQYLSTENYKYKTTEKIVHKIAMAKGDNRLIPTLKMPVGKNNVAIYFAGENEHLIYIDEYVYDLCHTMGKDSLSALACIVGHELGHYYEDHSNFFGFSSKRNGHNKKELEDAADKFSLFYGAVADYNTPRMFPLILDKIYSEYGIADKIQGYPDLKDRQAIVQVAITETEEFINIYRVGQHLYAINNYQAAKVCMEYILNHYPSKLVHNNIGVCNLSIFLNQVENQEIYPYIYPFEFDVRVRKVNTTESLRSRNQDLTLIDEAIHSFKEAIHADPYYERAYINLACAYSIRGNQDGASGTINELEQFIYKEEKRPLSENAYLVKGICKALDENYVSAKQAFDKVISNSDINLYNKKVFNAEYHKHTSYYENFKEWVNNYFSETEKENKKVDIDASLEKIAGKLTKNMKLDSTFTKVDLGNWVNVYYKSYPSHISYIYKEKNNSVKMQITHNNYTQKTGKGIKIMDDYEKVISQDYYGPPSFKWNKKPLSIISYEHGKIGFLLENDIVINWFTWTE